MREKEISVEQEGAHVFIRPMKRGNCVEYS